MCAPAIPRARDVIADLAARGRYHFTSSELRSVLGVSDAAARQALSRLAAKGRDRKPGAGVLRHRAARVQAARLPAGGPIHSGADGAPERPVLRGAALGRAVPRRGPSSPAGIPGGAGEEPAGDRVRRRPRRLCRAPRAGCRAGRERQQSPWNDSGVDRGGDGGRSRRIHACAPGAWTAWRACSSSSATTSSRSASSRRRSPRPSCGAQRLGYLLEHVGAGDRATLLKEHVRKHARNVTRLLPGADAEGAWRSKDWRLLVNASIEREA